MGDLLPLIGRFISERAHHLFADYAGRVGVAGGGRGPAGGCRLVHFAETTLAGAVGAASARVMVASVVEAAGARRGVIGIFGRGFPVRAYSRRLEQKSLELRRPRGSCAAPTIA